MEDILSSIKRIIAEEGDGAPRPIRRPARTPAPRDEPEIDSFDRDEILELSDPVRPDPIRQEALREPARAEPPARPEARAPEPAATPRTPSTGGDSLLSTVSAEVSRGALDALSRMIVKPEVPGSETLEGMVREMLRPMLRDWLDAKLPDMVEAMVAREIARITGQSR